MNIVESFYLILKIVGSRPDYAALFVVAVFIFCSFPLFTSRKHIWQRRLLANGATLIISSGIALTFVGIFVGLYDFNIENINEGIASLLAGMQTAFLSSVVGIILSILFRLILVVVSNSEGSGGQETSAADIHDALLQNQKTMEEGFSNLQKAIGGEGDASLITQIKNLRTDTRDKLGELGTEIKNLATTMGENFSKELIKGLEEVIRDFNEKLTEQFGENFKQLNSAVKELVTWQEQYKNQLNDLIKAFEISKESLQTMEGSMKSIVNDLKPVPDYLENLQGQQNALQEKINELTSTLDAFATMKSAAEAAFPAIEKGLIDLTTELQSKIDGVLTTVQEGAQTHIKNLETSQQSINEIGDMAKQSIEDSKKIKEDSAAMIGEVRQSLVDAVNNYNENLTKSLQSQSENYQQIVDGAVKNIEKLVGDAITSSQQSMGEVIEFSKDTIEKSAEVKEITTKMADEISQGLESGLEQYNQQLLKLFDEQNKEYKTLMKNTAARMEEDFKEAFKSLKGGFTEWDKEMQEETKRLVLQMASHLESVTEGFVQKYQRIVDSEKNSKNR